MYVSALALIGSLSLLPACTFVVGDEPSTRRDAGTEAGSEPEPDDSEPDDDSGLDGAISTDAAVSTVQDAGGASDAGPAMEAAVSDASGRSEDSAAQDAAGDAAPAGNCDGGGTLWYPDGDEDGFGRSAESVRACAKPSGAWAPHAGDCKDNHRDVHPEQSAYFAMGFTGADGNESFDYDCSGAEEGNPAQRSLENGCDGILDLLSCSGTGYMARARAGAGVNAVCGSNKIGTCTPMLLSCTTAMGTDPAPYRCK